MKRWNLQHGGDQIISAINITPLTDVMLVLLVIFMVTTPLMVMESFKIKLPKAASAGSESGEGVTIAVAKDGTVTIDNQQVSRDDLFDHIKERLAGGAGRPVVVKADTDTFHGAVVDVLDTAKRAGARRLSIATVPERGR